MARRSDFGKLLGFGLFVGGVAGALSLLTDRKARAATLQGATDWSGCGEPPSWAKPAPRYRCGETVTVDAEGFAKGKGYVIAGRVWSRIPGDPNGFGLWVYSFAGTGSYTEEANLAPQGGSKMATREEQIKDLARQIATEQARPAASRDEKKLAKMKADIAELAKAEMAARPATPPAPKPVQTAPAAGPWYPVGLQASFGGKSATILKAWQDGQGAWHYKIDLKAGMLFGVGDGEHDVSQETLRSHLSNALGAMDAAQAYPRGLTLYRGGQGGLIAAVSRDGNGFTYQIQGWPSAVSQSQLLGILSR